MSVYVIEAKRSAVGKYGGSLVTIPAVDIASTIISSIFTEHKNLKNKVDEVILGNVLPAGIGQNPARIAAIKAGLNKNTPAYTINKVCGSSLKSVILGMQEIQNEEADFIVAGGMENMSRCPYYLDNYRFGAKFGNQTLRDGMIHDGLFCPLIGEHMGMTAEYLANKYDISREDQDKYAFNSHRKAIKAIDEKRFEAEITPITAKTKKGDIIFRTDEQPRNNTSMEVLGKLKPAFKKNGTVTAGNSCSINDGASVVLLASDNAVKKYKIKPQAVIRSYATVGLDPKYMGLGSYYAVLKCLEKAGMKVSDINLWEVNEAFASQSIAVINLLGVDEEKVNVNGGAIALGHPIGASGARILTTLLYELKRSKLQYGVASLCIGGGQGIAVLIENI